MDAVRVILTLAMAIAIVPRGRHHCTHAASATVELKSVGFHPKLACLRTILGNEAVIGKIILFQSAVDPLAVQETVSYLEHPGPHKG